LALDLADPNSLDNLGNALVDLDRGAFARKL
jgi:hypothetical protein